MNQPFQNNSRVDRPKHHRPKVRIGPRANHEHKPEIIVKKHEGRIETITVVCGCGEEIVIDCSYGGQVS